MPDILSDNPTTFAAGLPDLKAGDTSDFKFHNAERQALRALNKLVFADRGAPGLTVRSVVEDGAVADDLTDNLLAFQTTLNTVAAAGGGIALVPAAQKTFLWVGMITIPANVILRGLGDRSVVRGIAPPERSAIRFAPDIHRGGVENLVLLGNEKEPPFIGIDLSGAHFLRLRNFQVWDFQIGLCMSNGVTAYAGYNHVSDFEVNRCHVGIRAWMHCNQASVLNGRIYHCRAKDPEDPGIALDIQSAAALTVAHVAIEDFDLGVRITGRTSVSLRDVYYEADPVPNPFADGLWMDIRPEKGSIVRMENSVINAKQSLVMGGSLEDAITNDERSHIYNGAKRHHAAAPERNLLENGDFHRADGETIPGWVLNLPGTIVAENNDDFVTCHRSYDITQGTDANDGLRTAFTVPETTDYVTVMVRYKNISSASLLFRVASGANAVLHADPLPPSDEWRVATMAVEVDPAAAGVVIVTLTADQTAAGGQIRVDEVWAVVGATAAPPRAHAHRVEMLHEPVTVLTRDGLTEDFELELPTDLTKVPGLGGAPRGIIGAILSLRGTATPIGGDNPQTIGATLARVVRPFVRETSTGQEWSLDILFEQLELDRQIVVRGTSIKDGIHVFDGLMATSYRVDVVGWVLPS